MSQAIMSGVPNEKTFENSSLQFVRSHLKEEEVMVLETVLHRAGDANESVFRITQRIAQAIFLEKSEEVIKALDHFERTHPLLDISSELEDEMSGNSTNRFLCYLDAMLLCPA